MSMLVSSAVDLDVSEEQTTSIISPEDGCSMFLRNVGLYDDVTNQNTNIDNDNLKEHTDICV